MPAVSPHSPSHSSILLFSSWPKSLISRFSEDELLYSEVPTPERILVWQHTSVVLPAELILWAPLLKLPVSQASEHKMNHTIGFPGSLDRDSRTFRLPLPNGPIPQQLLSSCLKTMVSSWRGLGKAKSEVCGRSPQGVHIRLQLCEITTARSSQNLLLTCSTQVPWGHILHLCSA